MSSYRSRRQRAPKPLKVPLVGALAGFILFFLGMVVASATIAGLGLLVMAWGVLSALFLVINRFRKARKTALRG